jgi:ABC transport system ATP-binding/permease protein
MSERILQALMQLFAIVAKVDINEDTDEIKAHDSSRNIVELFLNQELNNELVQKYLSSFDEFIRIRHSSTRKKDGRRKRTSVNSVKVLRICTQINEELEQRQKVIVLIRILDFIFANKSESPDELEFAETVADTFNISKEEYQNVFSYIKASEKDNIDNNSYLYINESNENINKEAKHINAPGIKGHVIILQVPSVKTYFIRYFGNQELYLNGQLLPPNSIKILRQGSSLRNPKIAPVYFSDIIAQFLSTSNLEKIEFVVNDIEYEFQAGNKGVHSFSFKEDSGRLIGIMGGSGSGKSTLLNVLNGNYPPSKGEISINGINLYEEKEKLEGVIGFVPQDDLLIEELTVYQNLFYNAKLCFGNYNDQEIDDLVIKVLFAIGLHQAKDLKVGSPLAKTISGGQRKRLNIALELVREPSILFVDEPTSGLSSKDSEIIMDLLKVLALKGKLIFVVIHQPSSDIYKMFDKLIIFDVGGYPIYNGDPVDAVVYFKKLIKHVNADESECETCGNVNPEQIFNIIDMKVVDEYGLQTQQRKTSPEDWNNHYHKIIKPANTEPTNLKIPESIFKVPNIFKQLGIFFIRDVKSKLTNFQYMMITLFEAPVLAAILAFFMKYMQVNFLTNDYDYSYFASENIPQYLFISVIVALFIGLTTSAEEIIGNLKILKREQFLNLSKGSYLFSKISIMFLISAIQTILYVMVGNSILEIKGMFVSHWLILFSTSCFANLLGLNISSSFNSVKVIYILIPICIIPQLLFSGIIVPYDKLHPYFSSKSHVPTIGNVMASRWAYEALTVSQFKDNDFEKLFFKYDKKMSFANWKKDQWESSLETKLNNYYRNFNNKELGASKHQKMIVDREIIINEIKKELRNFNSTRIEKNILLEVLNEFEKGVLSKKNKSIIFSFLSDTREYYKGIYKKAEKEKDKVQRSLIKPDSGFIQTLKSAKEEKLITSSNYSKYKKLMSKIKSKKFQDFKQKYNNKSLEDFVTNANTLNFIDENSNSLIQKSDPIYLDPYDENFLVSHFYSPTKKIFGFYLDTYLANLLVIWGMTFLLIITLYFDTLRYIIESLGKISKLKKKFIS